MVGTWIVGLLLVPLLGVALAGPSAAGEPATEHIRRTTWRWRWAGVAFGAVAAAVAARADPLGRGVLLAAPLFGLCVLAGVVAGEGRVVARPAGTTRQAALETRQVRHYLPRRPFRAVAAAGAALAVLLAATTAAGSADDLGRAGRSLAYACGEFTAAHGPWAGSFYSLPLALLVGLGVLIATLALRRLVGRPRPQAPAGALVHDDAERRRSATAVTGACGVLITIPLIGVSLFTATGLLSNPCRPAWWTAAAWGLLLLLPAWTVLLAWSAVAVLRPGQRADRPAPVTA
ncbi:hypothetical protein [Micromonospora narathiwatensis]|uniref:Uncharacterized protein n=1 Tax=Micromonospora narathiwatensis TaxID=299146 RepID=A0A1A9AFE0_9ACTN|nr:hypothetical protein [Micromonospora narathiwatensis]SBT54862.1 hypothetical protein GA0070621_5754 [Micromonospora narathiwatensis]